MVIIKSNSYEKDVYILFTTSDVFSSPLLGVYATREEAEAEYLEVQEEYCLEDYELSIEHSTYTFKFKEGV